MLTKGKLLLAGGWAVGQMIEGLERGVDCFMPTAMHEIYVRIYTLFQEGHKTAARELLREYYQYCLIQISILIYQFIFQRNDVFTRNI